ncbi:MAG TPA: hypothetical protein VNZ86_12315 [Bacteroidia bacterium]|jgi:hypothetical protein|nr:hypothetical protein [Bacteroidia bacterium]
MLLNRYLFALLLVSCSLFTNSLSAQCKSFAKKNVLPKLSPYITNGQLNTTTMSPGQSADMLLNFNSGQSYRIVVMGEGVLEPVEFTVTDASGKVVFKNKDGDSYTDTWDFTVQQTTQLTLNVKVPDQVDKTQLNTEGCVSVLIGFKK